MNPLHPEPRFARRCPVRGLPLLLLTLARISHQPSVAAAEEQGGSHCLGETKTKVVMHQMLAGQVNPNGVQNDLRLGVCVPLITRPGVLFDYTHLEVGLASYLSPVYHHFGGYIQVAPISPLVLRAQLTQITHWNIAMDRTGYHGLASYDAPLQEKHHPSEEGGHAYGVHAAFSATLQLRVPLGRVSLVVLDMLSMELWRLGEEPYYVNLRYDLALARTDWVLANEAIALVELPWGNRQFRVGLYDGLAYVPATRYLGNHAGLMLMLAWPRPRPMLRDLQIFVRLGAFTNHAFRLDGVFATGFAGVLVDYDLGLPQK